jgi:GNAT superfamily N-acetyltransferase
MRLLAFDCKVDGVRTSQLVAFGDDDRSGRAIVGMVELLYQKANPDLTPRRSACIRMLFVHRSFRKQGIGRQLVNEACEIARSYGCETLGLRLAAINYSGAEFYRKLGFQFAYEYDDGSFVVTKNLREPQSAISHE